MVNTLSINGKPIYGINEYICDEEADLEDLNNSDCLPGSTAYIIETGNVYILSGKIEWVKMK